MKPAHATVMVIFSINEVFENDYTFSAFPYNSDQTGDIFLENRAIKALQINWQSQNNQTKSLVSVNSWQRSHKFNLFGSVSLKD